MTMQTDDDCYRYLERNNFELFHVPVDNNDIWCNATWDSFLCWPAIKANTSYTQHCPLLEMLDPNEFVTKECRSDGLWMGRNENDTSRPAGYTNFHPCFLDIPTLEKIARNARKIEFVGLGLSLISLLFSIFIFSYFRRLRVFRNMMHLQLMIAILMVVTIRLTLYIDLIINQHLNQPHENGTTASAKIVWTTINNMPIVCEAFFLLLEYFKTVAFSWMFLEGFYLHNLLVLTVFNSEPRLLPYLAVGYGIPLVHTFYWLMVVLVKKNGRLDVCLGSYYLLPEFWILDGPRMAELVVNLFFIGNVIRVLVAKVPSGEMDRMKKSVKAALMLIILLGIPNIMQTIPYAPTKHNLTYFAIWTYCASFTYMYQGFLLTIIYCFTNREVIRVIKTSYGRYRLQHSSAKTLSKSTAVSGNNNNRRLQLAASTNSGTTATGAAITVSVLKSNNNKTKISITSAQPLISQPSTRHESLSTNDTISFYCHRLSNESTNATANLVHIEDIVEDEF